MNSLEEKKSWALLKQAGAYQGREKKSKKKKNEEMGKKEGKIRKYVTYFYFLPFSNKTPLDSRIMQRKKTMRYI